MHGEYEIINNRPVLAQKSLADAAWLWFLFSLVLKLAIFLCMCTEIQVVICSVNLNL